MAALPPTNETFAGFLKLTVSAGVIVKEPETSLTPLGKFFGKLEFSAIITKTDFEKVAGSTCNSNFPSKPNLRDCVPRL